LALGISVVYYIFKPVFVADSIIFPYAIHPFDICKVYPDTWKAIKIIYILTFLISYNLFLIKIFRKIKVKNKERFAYTKIKDKSKIKNKLQIKVENESKHVNKTHSKSKVLKNSELKLVLGKNENDEIIEISENGLYQNIFITGTIGSGKTSSAMYPLTLQLIGYDARNTEEKIAMLILDVKGNYSEKVMQFATKHNRQDDVCVINISGNIKYNPLDKPELKPIVLANRLKTILTLFNKNNSESYWLDKAEQVLAECIKFCRIYNDGYVTFTELHKLIMFPKYYEEKVEVSRKKFKNGLLKQKDIYDLLSCINFFDKEFFSLDQRTLSILKSEISRITNVFVSDYNVSKTFCPAKEEINFHGFDEVLDKGKIVVLNMNIYEYKNLSKIIAAYLKLDFQTTVMSRLNNNKNVRKSAFISDEYHEYVTDTDADFFSQSREAKCINIIATQSYTSLLNSLKEESVVKVIVQSLVSKIWYRTDDVFTIEEIQKQLGKEEKEKYSTTISENAKETNYNMISNKLISRDTNISESYNKYTEKDYIYDSKFFSQELETFNALCFISNGYKISKPQKVKMQPYFEIFNKPQNNNLKGFDLNE
jgi:hypothetical protein